MAYVLKDTVSGKYWTKTRTLDASVANAEKWNLQRDALSFATRLQKIHDSLPVDKDKIQSRGYTASYAVINPVPRWSVVKDS